MNKSLLKDSLFLKMINDMLIKLPSPVNISIWWNMGSLLGLLLIMQILTGLFLSMHYVSNINYSFLSIVHIMHDVNYGWLIRLLHMNGASFFFICVYLHIGRGIYYGSYKSVHTWYAGILILLMMMGTAFMGYVLPWGQMSFWGATVITNLLSALPYIGSSMVEWLWGGFSVDNPTLNRFYTIHFILPIVLLVLVLMHLILLHEKGSNNPMGVNSNFYKISFHNYYILKDLLGYVVVFIMIFYVNVKYPYYLGDPDNFIVGNPMSTPIHIQPEWYFLFAYTILRSIPNKLSGVLALLMSILILFLMPLLNKSNFQNLSFYFYSQMYFWFFFSNILILTWLGSRPVEYPYIFMSQFCTVMYFLYFFMDPLLKYVWDKYLE